MQYCNDCFAKLDDKAKHCKACQSRDIRPFVTPVKNETSKGISKEFAAPDLESAEEPEPSQVKKINLDPKYLVEPKPKASDVRPKDLLYFPSNPKLAKVAKRNAGRSAKAQRRSRLAARGNKKQNNSGSFGAGLALFGPMALVLALLGFGIFTSIPEEVKDGSVPLVEIAATPESVEIAATPERLIPRVEVETNGSFTWLDGGKKPAATWDPCRTIYWVVNPSNEPEIARQMVADAFSEVGARTGLKFEFLGETNEKYKKNRSPVNTKYPKLDSDWSPVLVTYLEGATFQNAAAAYGYDLTGNIAAFAGPDSAYDKNTKEVYVSGTMTISTNLFFESMRDWGGIMTKTTFKHEIGHLVGLGHVNDDTELMYPNAMITDKFGPGDRKGLALAGQAKCLSPLEYPQPEWTDWSEYD